MKDALKNGLKKHKILVIALAGGISILLLFMITLGCMTLTTQQFFPRPEITPEDWMRQSRVVMKGMQQFTQEDPTQVQKLRLAPEDVAALLKFLVNNDQIGALFSGNGAPEGVLWTITYDKQGLFHAAYLADTGVGNLRSHLRVTAQVRYENNAFEITPVDCRVGSLKIPLSMVRKHILPRVYAELEENNYIQMFHQAVESITPDHKNRLVIRYIPDHAKIFAMGLFR